MAPFFFDTGDNMKLLSKILSGFLILGLLSPVYCDDKKSPDVPKVVKMEEIKQELTGLEKEYAPGKVIKVKISPLPKSTNKVTAIYKLTLLENGKRSANCEVLTKVERSTDEKRDGSDFIFAAECTKNIRYQVLFAVTYIEQNDAKEVVQVYNPDISIYDVKIQNIGPDVIPDNIPDGANGFIKLVYLQCEKVNLDPEKRQKLFINLSNSFSGMSTKIAAGVFKDSDNQDEQINRIQDFLKKSKEENNKAKEDAGVDKLVFEGNMDVAVKTKLSELLDSGKLRKFSEFQAIWAEMSEGYRLAAKK